MSNPKSLRTVAIASALFGLALQANAVTSSLGNFIKKAPTRESRRKSRATKDKVTNARRAKNKTAKKSKKKNRK